MEFAVAWKLSRWKWRESRLPTAFHFDMDVNQLKSWTENVSQAVMIVNDSGVVVAINHPFQRLISYSVEEIEGRAFFHFLQLPIRFQAIRGKVDLDPRGAARQKKVKRIPTNIHMLKKQILGQNIMY